MLRASRKQIHKVDLPTLGLPTITVSIPSRNIRPDFEIIEQIGQRTLRRFQCHVKRRGQFREYPRRDTPIMPPIPRRPPSARRAPICIFYKGAPRLFQRGLAANLLFALIIHDRFRRGLNPCCPFYKRAFCKFARARPILLTRKRPPRSTRFQKVTVPR